jgi:hypothetical protein
MPKLSKHGIRFLTIATVLIVLAVSGLGFVVYGGSSRGSFREAAGKLPSSWNELVGAPRHVNLQAPHLAGELMSVRFILVDPAGNLIIPDGVNGRILVFSSSGKLIREIGHKGQGPGEFNILSHAALDAEGRLVAYDVDGHRFSIFNPGTYKLADSFQVLSPVTQVAALQDGLAIYSPYNQQVIAKIDTKGKIVRAALPAERERLRLFLCRFQNGGIVEDGAGGLFGVYPETFAIYHFDKDLGLVGRLDGGSSKWRPDSPGFPDSLSPYEYTPAHQRWWDSHLHVDEVFNISPSLLGVTLYKSDGPTAQQWYLNVYTKKGEILAEGLPIPHQGRVVAANNCKLWVARNAYLQDDGQVVPFELLEYPLRAGEGWGAAGLCPVAPVQVAGGKW